MKRINIQQIVKPAAFLLFAFVAVQSCKTKQPEPELPIVLDPTIPDPPPQTDFTFNGSMSKDVLRAYASRSVTSWLLMTGDQPDPIFEEDLRMTLRIGAKYLGRAASYSWSGNMSAAQIDEHFKQAKAGAAIIHQADPEIILEAGVFEIAYQGTVNATPVPSWVFQDFGLPVVTRNFRYEDVVFPTGHELGPGFWGTGASSAVPKIANVEAQMYFYYSICRYIDAGFEAFHLGQIELMMNRQNAHDAVEWDRVTTLARTYAKKHARRGVALFDGHVELNTGGLKVGNRLIMDLQPAGLVPNETQNENGILKCSVEGYDKCWLSWIGRSIGGEHPLGWTTDHNISIIEFDNYGGNGNPGVATPCAFFNWGYDDITWFTLQPESYRNQYLKECSDYFKSHWLDSQGKQVYFIQPSLRRTITANQTITYKPGVYFNESFVMDYFGKERINYDYDPQNKTYILTVTGDYRANRQSDGCPNGSGQEDTIREIFIGKDAPENPEWVKVVLPPAYAK